MDGLRIREAARAVLLDPDDRVLLVRFEFPGDIRRWALPGGGVEPGESHVDALHRELREETGLVGAAIGEHIWTRLHIVAFLDGRHDGQRETIHLVRTSSFEPQPTHSWEQLNAEYVFELRWWSVDEIAGSSETFVPAGLATHLRALADEGPPNSPVDVGI